MEQTNKPNKESISDRVHRLLSENCRDRRERREKQARLNEMRRQEDVTPEEIAALEAEIEKARAKEKEVSAEIDRLLKEAKGARKSAYRRSENGKN